MSTGDSLLLTGFPADDGTGSLWQGALLLVTRADSQEKQRVFAIEVVAGSGSGATAGEPMLGLGQITVGGFSESFQMYLGYWDAAAYRRS